MEKKYARIVDGVAIDISSNPAEHFHPDVAKDFVEVPAVVSHGWRLINGNWFEPAAAEAGED
jgi:hypothetical protein